MEQSIKTTTYTTYRFPMSTISYELVCNSANNNEMKKDKAMISDTQTKIDYLLSRARRVYNDKTEELKDKFFLNAPNGPSTIAEAEELLKKGQWSFVYDGDKTKKLDNFFNSPMNFFSWRTADQKQDYEGYEKATKELLKTYTAVKDTINVKSADDGLKALQEFETWTYTA